MPPAPSGPATWAPPPPAPEAPPPEAPRSHRGLILPIVAVIVLIVGLGLAIGGLAARGSAQTSADEVAAQLVTVTQDRDLMATDAAKAATDLQNQQATLAESTAEAQRVNVLTPALMTAADQLLAGQQAMAEAEAAFEAALATNDPVAGNRAIDAYNAAVGRANAAIDQFESVLMQILLGSAGGVVIDVA
jgi:hypothetical protein